MTRRVARRAPDDASPDTASPDTASPDTASPEDAPLTVIRHDAPARTAPPRRTFGARRVTRAALVGLVAVVVIAGLLGRGGTRGGLHAQWAPDPGARVDTAPDLDSLDVVLVLANDGDEARTVDGVQVSGLGQVAVDPRGADPQGADPQDADPRGADPQGVDPQGATLRIAPGAGTRLPLRITPDCGLLYRDRATVSVDGHTLTPTGADPRTLLAALCPAPVSGPAVDAVAARADPGGPVVVRVVNHGSDPVTITVPAAAPVALHPGEAATLRITVPPSGCPARTDPPRLRAGTPQGEVPIGGWPSALLDAAARPAAACRP